MPVQNAKDPAEKQADYEARYHQRVVNLREILDRTLKVLDEHLTRHERHLTAGMQYKAEKDHNFDNWDANDAKAAAELSKNIRDVLVLHEKVTAAEKAAYNALSRDQKAELAVRFLISLPKVEQQKAVKRLQSGK